MIEFGRELCNNREASSRLEWLVTNGIGGYASGTVAGMLTRRYHGLLIAPLNPPLERTLLLVKLDETTLYDGHIYTLFSNHWAGGEVEPKGFYHLERFHLEGTIPVWTYGFADALLEKRVWMQPGENTTHVQYHLSRGSHPLTLMVKAMVNWRDHHANTHVDDWQMQVEEVAHGLRFLAFEGVQPFYLLSDTVQFLPCDEWYQGYFLEVENYRGLDEVDSHFYGGFLQTTLVPGETLTLVASTEPNPNLDGEATYAQRRAYEQGLVAQSPLTDAPEEIQQLVLAAEQFIVRRQTPTDPNGQTVIAGYPWFGDWGRDTMISLPGLTLATGRQATAASILRTFASYVDRGMLPNRFPEIGEKLEYNTVDATLWYFEAIRAYHAATGDDGLLQELYPVLVEIIGWHKRGTRFNIHLDENDGLLYAGEAGVQLTWMDVKIGDWVVTPRTGKQVEINALWYNALRCMVHFAGILEEPSAGYQKMADQAQAGFSRFWNASAGYCYDVLDGPDGHNAALRPNQLFAVSLHHSPLSARQQRAVVDVCARHLLTPHGMRSLAADHTEYEGHYGGDQRSRDSAYHQGTVWGWLIGPFVEAHLRVYKDPELARSYLDPLIRQLNSHGIGSISEIFDGEPPFTPRGCFAQAWSVAEVLRVWERTRIMLQ